MLDDRNNHMTLFVHLSCNRNCLQCSQRGLMRSDPYYSMSLDDVRQFIDATQKSGYPRYKSVIISGGEPLLWPHLAEGARLIREAGIARLVNVFSNGMAVGRVTDEIIRAISTLRLSRYKQNHGPLDVLRSKYGPKVQIVDREKHSPIPKRLLDGVLPAVCNCEGLAIYKRQVYACPMVPAVSLELGLPIESDTVTNLSLGYVERLDGFDRAGHELCRGCIGNMKVRTSKVPA